MDSPATIALYWNNQLIGVIENVKVDHYTIYGQWKARDDLAAQPFLDSIASGDEPWVEMHSHSKVLHGTVQWVEDMEIEIKLRPS